MYKRQVLYINVPVVREIYHSNIETALFFWDDDLAAEHDFKGSDKSMRVRPVSYTHLPNSQDLPNVVALNFGVTVVRKEDLIKNSNIIGKNPQFVIASDIEAIDIDTPLDFYIAEQLYKKTEIEKKGLLE